MLSRFRREIRMIRYYSADRRRSPWRRAKDTLLVLALPLAIPAMLLAEQFVHRAVALEEIDGELARLDDGSVVAQVKEDSLGPWTMEGTPHGEFELELRRTDFGWPLTSRRRLEGVQLDLHLFSETMTRRNTTLPADSPVRYAIEDLLRSVDESDLLRAWHRPDTTTASRMWYGTIFGVALWWIILTFVFVVLTSIAQLGVMMFRSQRASKEAQLIAEGKCHVCGYDMRGLEFNERCPECGSLVR